jgi:hypothetical protein
MFERRMGAGEVFSPALFLLLQPTFFDYFIPGCLDHFNQRIHGIGVDKYIHGKRFKPIDHGIGIAFITIVFGGPEPCT